MLQRRDLRLVLLQQVDRLELVVEGARFINEADESALSRIEPFLEPLREATRGELMLDNRWGKSCLKIDTRDRANRESALNAS